MQNNLPTTKQNSNLTLKRAESLLDITDKILNKNSPLTKEVFDYNFYIGLGHIDNINSIVITPDDKYIVSGSNDGTIKLFDFESKRELRTFEGHSGYINSVAIRYKYFNFQNDKEVITDKSHPIYKQRKKDNLLEGIL